MLILLFAFVSCNNNNASTPNNVVLKAVNKPLSEEVNLLMENLDSQIITTKSYDPNYVSIAYPNGDVPMNTGVCADVIVRALRSNHIDLQKEIHEDMSENFDQYPNIWHLSSTDKNIDHRRVPNLMTFFERKGKQRAITNVADDYLPGDIVAWKLPNNLFHIGMVSDDVNELGIPIIIHNIGSGTQKADVLFQWKIIGHYRWFN